jgi:hypothetical protein
MGFFLLEANPTFRCNLFIQNFFFYELAGTSFGRSANSRKNKFFQKRIFAAIGAKNQ